MGLASQWMIYGATGYSGRHIAKRAVEAGLRPVLAGRNGPEIAALAESLGLPSKVFELQDEAAVAWALQGHSTLLNCAGPFTWTWKPLLEACLKSGVHYLDIGGEVEVYEALATYDGAARDAGIAIMPAVGFDMVPGDCLALMLKEAMPDACSLDIAYSFDGTISRGSARTAFLTFTPEAKVRCNGKIESQAPSLREFDFGAPLESIVCASATFGDVSIAWRTTGISHVRSWLHITEAFQQLATLSDEKAVAALPEGPSAEELRTNRAYITAEIRNPHGDVLRARAITPQVYALTFILAADIATRVTAGDVGPGFKTAAAAFGKDFIRDFDCTLEWLA